MEHKQTAYVILGILAIHPHQSGYEIRKTIQSSVGFFWGESFGQIYPTLKRLAAEGLIVPSQSGTKPRPGRQEYSITEAGKECLREWMAIPFRVDPPRSEFLLKLFFGREAAPGVSIEHVLQFQEKSRQMLATILELEGLARVHNSQQRGFPFWMLTLKFGVAQLRSALEWSDAALAMLKEMEADEAAALQEESQSAIDPATQ